MERSYKMNTARVIALKKFLVKNRAWSAFRRNMKKNLFFTDLTEKEFLKKLEDCSIELLYDYYNVRWSAPGNLQLNEVCGKASYWRDLSITFIRHIKVIEHWHKYE